MPKSFDIICGHYGCGKTNLTLNLAVAAAKRGEKVCVVDLDIVNPYFRSTEYTSFLEESGIRVVSPSLAGTTLDSPSLSAEIYSTFDFDGTVLFDVGGDDVGAGALGRFARRIKQEKNVRMLYAINHFRPMTATPQGAVDIMHEIERSSSIKVDALVNTSHLCSLTTAEDILAGYDYAKKTSELCSLPLLFTAVNDSLVEQLQNKIDNIFPVKTMVKLPF